MASHPRSLSKEDQFFAKKRPWSRIKDAVVGPYMVLLGGKSLRPARGLATIGDPAPMIELNQDRLHRSLGLVTRRRPVDEDVVSQHVLGGLHHVFERAA